MMKLILEIYIDIIQYNWWHWYKENKLLGIKYYDIDQILSCENFKLLWFTLNIYYLMTLIIRYYPNIELGRNLDKRTKDF